MPLDFTAPLPVGFALAFMLKVMPPRVMFGSPVQRSKYETQSWWHVPISIRTRLKVGPGQLPACRIYAEFYNGDNVQGRFKLAWGDTNFEALKESVNLSVGDVVLVPIVWRKEGDHQNDLNAYLTDAEYHNQNIRKWGCPNDRMKRRFRLIVVSGERSYKSPHAYLIRVPQIRSNGNFVVEIEYEGHGTASLPLENYTLQN